jgi:hypothetical protein
MKKADIYNKYSIEYKAGKIHHNMLGWINPVLVDGNEKIGKGIFHFSTLPGTKYYTGHINDCEYILKGTCKCNCKDCYAMTGNYNFQSTIDSLAVKTWLAYYDIEFLNNAIRAQLEADNIKAVRIHASGDFVSREYMDMFKSIVADYNKVVFWTYTKVTEYEKEFDAFPNANIVKSIVPGIGFNFGHCDYIINAYDILNKAGKSVHICRCGVDKNQHCNNCKGCLTNEFVLFLEHSTNYKAEKDPLFDLFKQLVESQAMPV